MRSEMSSSIHLGPSADEVRAQLERILSSPHFVLPDRGRKFLSFVITETLEGRSNRLKAFALAQDVFGRGAHFDAQNDPCVRMAAGHLRRALERYYLTGGALDELLITIPRGGYVPLMTIRDVGQDALYVAESSPPQIIDCADAPAPLEPPRRKNRAPPWTMIVAPVIVLASVLLVSFAHGTIPGFGKRATVGAKPTIIVEPFRTDSDGMVSAADLTGLQESIIVNVTKSRIVVVLDGSAPRNAIYLLQGNLRRKGDEMRSVARLVRQSDGVVTWSGDYDISVRGRSMLEVQEVLGRAISSAFVAPFAAGAATQSEGSTVRPANM